VILEIDVQPLTPSSVRSLGRNADQPGADPLPPHPRSHHGVKDESMSPAVPRHVDKPHQFAAPPGAHPSQAVPPHLGTPVNVTTATTEALRTQGIDISVPEIPAPVIGDRHPAIVGTTPPLEQARTRRGHHAAQQAGHPRPNQITIYGWRCSEASLGLPRDVG